jgi:PAS domain S-box-containing protein
LKEGAYDFIEKPFSIHQIEKIVQKIKEEKILEKEQKLLLIKLKQTKNFLEKIYFNIGAAVVVCEQNGTIINYNYQTIKTLCRKEKSLIGTNIDKIIFDQKVRGLLTKMKSGYITSICKEKFILQKAQRLPKFILLTVSPIDEDNFKGFICLFNDITDCYNLNGEPFLSEKNYKVEDFDKYKNICGSTIHNVKGEFFHIANSIKFLRDLNIDLNDFKKECDIIERSLIYSEFMLLKLMNLLEIHLSWVDDININEVLKEFEKFIRPRLPTNIDLLFRIEGKNGNYCAITNFKQLMLVLIELIENAVKILYQNGGIIEITIGEINDQICLKVKDNGSGINPGLRKIIFKKPIFKKNELGVGLYLCKKILDEIGGVIKLRSILGKGSTFKIILPRVKS